MREKCGEKMANTLIPGRLESKFHSAARKKAKLMKQEKKQVKREEELYAEFDSYCSDEMIREVFDSISKKGKPGHKKKAGKLKKRYEEGKFGFDEALALNELYKIVGKSAFNKEDEYE